MNMQTTPTIKSCYDLILEIQRETRHHRLDTALTGKSSSMQRATIQGMLRALRFIYGAKAWDIAVDSLSDDDFTWLMQFPERIRQQTTRV